MKRITLKKRSVSIIAGIIALALVGGTLAYYTSTATLENKLSTKVAGGEELVEQFTPKNDWLPGQKVTKVAGVENKGDIPLVVRVKMNETWTVKTGASTTATINLNSKDDTTFKAGTGQVNATDGLTASDKSVVIKEMTNAGWVFVAADGYWYWNKILQPGVSTPSFLTSITLNGTTDMGLKTTTKYYTTMATRPATAAANITGNPATGWAVLTGDMPAATTFTRSVSGLDVTKQGYSGANYSLFITYETFQGTPEGIAAAKTAGWNATATPTS